jgi:hypothetical protein
VQSRLFELLNDHVIVKKIPETTSVPFSLMFNEMPQDIIEDITVKLCYAEKFSKHENVNQPPTWPKAPENKVKAGNYFFNVQEHAKYKLKNKNPAKRFSGHVEDTTKYTIKPDIYIEIGNSIRKEAVDSLFEGDEEDNSIATVVLHSLLKV